MKRASPIRSEWGLAGALPGELRRYARPAEDALALFLERLSPARRARIVAEQAALPRGTRHAVRLAALARHSPVLHKLGQLLARDRRLPASLRDELQTLETLPPSASATDVAACARRELKRHIERGALRIGRRAIAEASVAVIIPAEWRSEPGAAPQRLVLKVLKPHVDRHLEQELAALVDIGGLLEQRCHDYRLPPIAYGDLFDRVGQLLRQEVDLAREQRNLREAADVYADCPDVVVPGVLPFSTPRVTVMQRIEGVKVTDCARASPVTTERLAHAAAQQLIARAIWFPAGRGLFHGDPHAGNLLRTDDGKLGVLDWSLTGHIGRGQAEAMMQLVIAAMQFREAGVVQALAALTDRPIASSLLRPVIERALGRLRLGTLPSFLWLVDLMDDAARQAGARFAHDLLLFRKVVHLLDGVLADMTPHHSIDSRLIASFCSQLMNETGPRLFALPNSRGFATHLSNIDLLELACSVPVHGLRLWHRAWTEWMSAWPVEGGSDGQEIGLRGRSSFRRDAEEVPAARS